jgi:hypothetical protein
LTAPAIPNSWTAPRVTELTLDCSNTVINRGQSRQEYVCGACLRGDGGGDTERPTASVGPGQAKPRNQYSPSQVALKPASRGEVRARMVQASGLRMRWRNLATALPRRKGCTHSTRSEDSLCRSGSFSTPPSRLFRRQPSSGSSKTVIAARRSPCCICLALRFLSGFSRARRYIADASYWLYLVHLPIVMALQVAVSRLDWPWPVKFAAILLIAFPLLFASYQLLVRYSVIGAALNGRRTRKAARTA